jgi:hypothetical protein
MKNLEYQLFVCQQDTRSYLEYLRYKVSELCDLPRTELLSAQIRGDAVPRSRTPTLALLVFLHFCYSDHNNSVTQC